MANEANKLQQLEDRYFQAVIADGSDGTNITAGSLMVYDTSADNTVKLSSTDGELFAGILNHDKKGGDGSTTVSLSTRDVWNITISPGATAVMGHPMKIIGANLIGLADDTSITGSSEWVGMALQAGTASEIIPVRLGHL